MVKTDVLNTHTHTHTHTHTLTYTIFILTASVTISEDNGFRVDALIVHIDDRIGARLVARGCHDDRASIVGVTIVLKVNPLHAHVHQLTNLNISQTTPCFASLHSYQSSTIPLHSQKLQMRVQPLLKTA